MTDSKATNRIGEPEGLERLLDQYKRRCHQAGIAQQKATEEGSRDETRMWLDKAEETRAEIIVYINRVVADAHQRGGRANLARPGYP